MKVENTANSADRTRISESAYLSQQADAAKAAMARSFTELKSSLLQSTNPAAWARAHPWIGVGAGAVAGFVAAITLVPSKEEQALRRLRRIEAALNPNKPPHDENANSNGHGKDRKGWIGLILKELLGVVGPLLANVLSAQAPPGPPPVEDGDPADPSA